MEGIITDLDREIHRRKTHFLIERLGGHGPASWEYDVTNGDKYSFTLKDGTNLDILEYAIDKKENENQIKHYDQYKVLLAKINDVVVGFVTIGIWDLKDRNSVTTESNIGVIIKGKGIGSRLETVKDFLLQKEANKQGDLYDIGDDENAGTVKRNLGEIQEKFKVNNNRDEYVKGLRELRRQRLQWLRLYGPGGKAGYTHNGRNAEDKYIFSKFYKKGANLPELNCLISSNNSNVREEVGKIKW